jgi:hypothetical protein
MEDKEIKKELEKELRERLEKELISARQELEEMQNAEEYAEEIFDIYSILSNSRWKTKSYELMTGKYTIWIDEEGLKSYWGGLEVKIQHTEKSKEKFQAICEYLDSSFEPFE